MPDNYALTILVDDVDVTEFIQYDSIKLDDFMHDVSYFRFTLENPTGVTPAQLQSVLVLGKSLDPVPIIFRGLIMEVQTKKRDNGITLEYVIEAADQKVRLQKSVLPDKIYTGDDTDIIDEIFGDVYPDLSDIFEIADGTTSFATDLELPVSDSSLLDALRDLGNRSGARWRIDRGKSVNPTISFTNVNDGIKQFPADEPYWTGTVFGPGVGTFSVSPSDGNPGHCAKWTQSGVAAGTYKGLAIDLFFEAGVEPISPVSLDVWYLGSGNDLEILQNGTLQDTIDSSLEGTWQSVTLPGVTNAYYPITFRIPAGASGANEIRVDNVVVGDIQGSVRTRDQLRWGDQPETTDFNLDIENSDEWAFDIDLSTGSIEDVNSVIVVGGKEDVAIDWIYGSFGTQDHFDLEKPVKGIQVYKNTGTDVSPTWTLQSLGIFGTDELTGNGGSKDVLYDAKDHWLYFDTNPAELNNGIRVTGTIEKPIRALVEGNVGSNPVLVSPIYDDTISSTEQAVAIGNAALNRINAAKRLSFTTYNPGLKVGQAIQVIDSPRGLNETLVIHTIRVEWLGASGHARFSVEAGEQETISADILIADLDKRTRLKAYGAGLTTSTINLLQDTDGENLLDTNNGLLYEVS